MAALWTVLATFSPTAFAIYIFWLMPWHIAVCVVPMLQGQVLSQCLCLPFSATHMIAKRYSWIAVLALAWGINTAQVRQRYRIVRSRSD